MMIDEMYNYREGSLPAVRLSEEWETLSAEFEATLTDEQLKMFHRLSDLQCTSSADEIRVTYKVGFKDGVALMRELQD